MLFAVFTLLATLASMVFLDVVDWLVRLVTLDDGLDVDQLLDFLVVALGVLFLPQELFELQDLLLLVERLELPHDLLDLELKDLEPPHRRANKSVGVISDMASSSTNKSFFIVCLLLCSYMKKLRVSHQIGRSKHQGYGNVRTRLDSSCCSITIYCNFF